MREDASPLVILVDYFPSRRSQGNVKFCNLRAIIARADEQSRVSIVPYSYRRNFTSLDATESQHYVDRYNTRKSEALLFALVRVSKQSARPFAACLSLVGVFEQPQGTKATLICANCDEGARNRRAGTFVGI